MPRDEEHGRRVVIETERDRGEEMVLLPKMTVREKLMMVRPREMRERDVVDDQKEKKKEMGCSCEA